ncbi:yippee zinc-binding/DNA-binding /Mis18, centromere assembly-domain-containing protein, partial [Ampelomyces quisqualis]
SMPSPTSTFPFYLLPSLPFRRRNSSTTTSTASTSPHPTSFFNPSPTSHLRCTKCLADLLPTSSIISKSFTGRHGRAYLVGPPPSHHPHLPNTHTHKPVSRQLVTGQHTVSDISCATCGSILGWKYVDAKEDSQKYKIGKFILESKRVVRGGEWEREWADVDVDEGFGGAGRDEEVEFDSQDEEECEDMFSGVWSGEGAKRRREGR